MPRPRDIDEIRKPEDILLRASRPQRNSTWLPSHRDWRYETGVYQHEDFDDAPRQRTIWDELDYDAQIGVFGRERRRVVDGIMRQDGRKSVAKMSEVEGYIGGVDGVMEAEVPLSATTIMTNEQVSEVPSGHEKNTGEDRLSNFRSRAQTVAVFELSDKTDENRQKTWKQTRFVVRLKLSNSDAAIAQRILNISSVTPCPVPTPPHTPSTPAPLKSPKTTSTARTAVSVDGSRIQGSINPISTFPLFERHWKDETRDFNMKKVVKSLRLADYVVGALPPNMNWLPEAVPIDALFPPGVPMSATEIHAYYPHHVRWKGVMLRLVNNEYRGADIISIQSWFRGREDCPLTNKQMNTLLRDTLRRTIPGFKTGEGAWVGKPDRNLYTDHLEVGKYIEDTRVGFVVPTFDDLLQGLKYLPTGLDARGLTQCLVWYLNHRDRFSPRMELNVLHTQSLIRALRQPLKAYGPQNLDVNALREWKKNGCFVERRVEEEERRHTSGTQEVETVGRCRLELKVDDTSVKPLLKINIRHVLTLPFVAMIAMADRGVQLGIKKAEERKAARLAGLGKDATF